MTLIFQIVNKKQKISMINLKRKLEEKKILSVTYLRKESHCFNLCPFHKNNRHFRYDDIKMFNRYRFFHKHFHINIIAC